jgi:hypothetical protein
MKSISLLLAIFLSCVINAQEPNVGTLTLVTDPVFNKFQVRVSASGFSDTKTTTLTGTLGARLNINHTNNTTDTMVVTSSNISASNLSFRLGGFLNLANFSTQGKKVALLTPGGIGPVNPATGTFDATLHAFAVNEGTLSGTALGSPISLNFAESPLTGTGTGNGSVTLTNRVEGPNRRISYTVTVTIPATINNDLLLNGTAVNIRITGTLRATGTIYVMRPITYAEWAIEQGVGPNRRDKFDLSPGISNGLLFGLGHNADTAPEQLFTPNPDGNLELNVAEEPREEVLINYSTDLMTWMPIPPERLLSAPGEPPVFSTVGSSGFYRVTTNE